MNWKMIIGVVGVLALVGCGKPQSHAQIVVRINDYVVTQEEFEKGFSESAYMLQGGKEASRQEYLDNLINQKLIVQDAVKKDLDKQKDFMQSVERFWEQSLMTIALGIRSKEIHGSIRVTEESLRRMYDQMIKEGLTQKSYEEMYPQIKWQAERQLESQLLNDWMDGLRKAAKVEINKEYLKP